MEQEYKKIVVTGATGYIGTRLCKQLQKLGFEVIGLTRNRAKAKKHLAYWDYQNQEIDSGVLENIDVLIHLAGAGVGEKRWTTSRKQEIIASRVESIAFLYQEFEKKSHWPQHIISASGINYYGPASMEKIYEEADAAGNDFLAQVTVAWEKAVFETPESTKVAALRTAVVFGKNSVALEKMAQPIRYFVGAFLGSGLQPVPWVHIDDVVQAYVHVLQKQLSGAYNLVAPKMVNNKTLTKAIGAALHRPIFPLPVPVFLLNFMLGEMAEIVTTGTAATPNKLVASGFQFQYSEVQNALANSFQNE